MKHFLTLLFSLLLPLFTFGQDFSLEGFEKTEIESGITFKKYKDGKLDSIIVIMAAVNYGNALLFSKTKDEISILNAEDKFSIIKITLQNKKQIKKFFYKDKVVLSIENIDFDLKNLPKNGEISSILSKGVITSFTAESSLDDIMGEGFPDKSLKLFSRLEIPANLTSIDEIFDSIGDYFSEEDSLVKIFYGSRADKSDPHVLAYLKIDEDGKIKYGAVYDYKNKKTGARNAYQTYNEGKIVKTGSATLPEFQNLFMNFMDEIGDY